MNIETTFPHITPHPRVVSLVPSLTELAIYLGLEVVGRTKFCIFPQPEVSDISKVGGTKTVDIDKVIALKPSLVLANKEENVKEQIEDLQSRGIATLVTEIKDFHSAIAAILNIGIITHKVDKSQYLAQAIKTKYAKLPQVDKNACYLIWKNPYMTVGGDTYINNMMSMCGLKNIYADQNRYPTLSETQLKDDAPELILLSSEPFPFKEKHIAELQSICPTSKIVLVDGTYFSWYGSRMLPGADYLSKLADCLR